MQHEFKLVNADTDSIMFCKPDGSAFSQEERTSILQDLNSQFPENINFSDDGYFSKVIVLKAKNYILWDGKKLKTKGSSLKSGTLEIAFKEFLNEIIQAILKEQTNYTEIYHKYVKEIYNMKDIKRFASRKTISQKTLESERLNESKIRDAIENTDYSEGDRIWVYFREDCNLELVENYKNDYNKDKLLEKLYKCTDRFSTIMDKSLFLNYKLKRNKAKLEELINGNCA